MQKRALEVTQGELKVYKDRVVKLETEAKMLAADRHRAEKRYVRIL